MDVIDKFMGDKRLGEILLEKGAIKESQLEHALEIQATEYSYLGKILVGENYIHNRELHEAIAERFGLKFVDLIQTPPNYSLFKFGQRQEYFNMQAVPFSKTGKTVKIAVTSLTPEIKEWALRNYQSREIRFVVTSPYDIRKCLEHKFAKIHDREARLKLLRQRPDYSAHKLFRGLKLNLAGVLLLEAFAAMILIKGGFTTMIALMNILFLASVTFKNLLFMRGWGRGKTNPPEISDFPVYTILLPLYNETRTLPKLIESMQNLDYPKAKLDIKFVVEATDVLTINAIKRLNPPQYMEIIAVPYSLPRTKPKACNYALNFARGEYVTIYDAEDMPEPGQLKLVLAKFAASAPNVVCVQARLNYCNYRDNILTRWFALEYAIWFDSVIKGLERMKMPVFLGGTSNHIQTRILREVGGWDAYNVTEDADLGMRLAQEGYYTTAVDSLTLEEAPNRLNCWIRQRTRWIKGFMQTYFVHMRDMHSLYKNTGLRGFFALQLLIGIPVFTYIFSPILLIASLLLIYASTKPLAFPEWLAVLCTINLIYGAASHCVMCLFAAAKAHDKDGKRFFKTRMIFSALTFYIYGVLQVFAAFRALYQLITAPHYWDKTEHGLARTARDAK